MTTPDIDTRLLDRIDQADARCARAVATLAMPFPAGADGDLPGHPNILFMAHPTSAYLVRWIPRIFSLK